MPPPRPAVFLDRDGTLNASVIREGRPYPPASLEELVLLPDVAEGCRRLKAAGLLLFIATNQPDVGRGTQTRDAVERMNDFVRSTLAIDGVEVCYHPGRGFVCNCRKPKPGMIQSAAKKWNLDLGRSWMIGDRWRDVDCGAAAGCRTVFIDHGYREALHAHPNFIVRNFSEAVLAILENS